MPLATASEEDLHLLSVTQLQFSVDLPEVFSFCLVLSSYLAPDQNEWGHVSCHTWWPRCGPHRGSTQGSFLTYTGFHVATWLHRSVDPYAHRDVRERTGNVLGLSLPRPETDRHPFSSRFRDQSDSVP